ncbi:metallophosphoesterase [Kibdelosporangium persicum]|uniref:3',5'-cyclic adenosine monophosphate phosphodiesterase CpdA n=1 Tax=Kibdelosporangium persicum TaxID=2698649 RepID=A0ABX2F3V5_9PSEU|nr:metallophosphoesterase [Kibdelosporangium persicum]NRN65982.1 3',5'-cyclic adenosine monophosphate phosphodiesterase CpdA [Kibdelosporangium persicum]
MIVLAHVSDIHIDNEQRSVDRATQVFDYLHRLPGKLDAILVTGDLADHGLPEEYEKVAKLFSGSPALLHCPGNHDSRGPYREVLLGESASGEPINRVHRVGEAVFAMCDSSIPGRSDGFLADETLAWLESVLIDAADAPVFVCFHHPPVLLHIPFIDGIKQNGEDRLAALITRYPNVVAVLCGHAHTSAASTFAGLPLLVAPGVVSTVMLPWETDEIVDLTVPPAVAFHILDDNRRLTTHYRVISPGL